MATSLVFVDTNVLIYARDVNEEHKRIRAQAWLAFMAERECMRLNLQVLNELARWVLGRERLRPIAEIRAEIESLHYWGAEPASPEDVEVAWAIRKERGFQWFDCLLVAAADRLGCDYFLTEDMVDGARYGDVTLINPFGTTPSELLQQH